jgi:DNA-binding transcriptional LysR family regulator
MNATVAGGNAGNSGYSLHSEDCELLLDFEVATTLAELGRMRRKDTSVLSRQLQRIAGTAPVLEKIQGRWRLTAVGRQLNRWTAEAIAEQKALLRSQPLIRLGASRTFATKALAPRLKPLRDAHPGTRLSLISLETGAESALLAGEVDIAFSCGKPHNPGVAFQRCAPERYVAAASPRFHRKYRLRDPKRLPKAPHLLLSSTAFPFPFPEIEDSLGEIHATYNDLLCTIEAALADQGWGVFPWYAVTGAIRSGQLQEIPYLQLKDEIYGVWWLRERRSLKPWADSCLSFLKGLSPQLSGKEK